MTLAALLEELKDVDPETWDDVAEITNVIRVQSDGSISTDADDVDFILQGVLQRAIVGRGWGFAICKKMAGVSTPDNIYDSPLCDSPAEALLAAYVAAVRGGGEAI